MKYSYSKVEEYCNQMKSINSDMKKQLDTITSVINTINSNWSGNAAQEFVKRFKKISNKFTDFIKELDACIVYMQKCSDAYENLEDEVKEKIETVLSESKIFS